MFTADQRVVHSLTVTYVNVVRGGFQSTNHLAALQEPTAVISLHTKLSFSKITNTWTEQRLCLGFPPKETTFMEVEPC